MNQSSIKKLRIHRRLLQGSLKIQNRNILRLPTPRYFKIERNHLNFCRTITKTNTTLMQIQTIWMWNNCLTNHRNLINLINPRDQAHIKTIFSSNSKINIKINKEKSLHIVKNLQISRLNKKVIGINRTNIKFYKTCIVSSNNKIYSQPRIFLII